jgi:hypothetical protein
VYSTKRGTVHRKTPERYETMTATIKGKKIKITANDKMEGLDRAKADMISRGYEPEMWMGETGSGKQVLIFRAIGGGFEIV